jgi:hypothetical protein
MAFAAAITDQFKQDILNGVHQPGDTYKIALYFNLQRPTEQNLTTYSGAVRTGDHGWRIHARRDRADRLYGRTLRGYGLHRLVHRSELDFGIIHCGCGGDLQLVADQARPRVLSFGSTTANAPELSPCNCPQPERPQLSPSPKSRIKKEKFK